MISRIQQSILEPKTILVFFKSRQSNNPSETRTQQTTIFGMWPSPETLTRNQQVSIVLSPHVITTVFSSVSFINLRVWEPVKYLWKKSGR
jgi:hypothetical protein